MRAMSDDVNARFVTELAALERLAAGRDPITVAPPEATSVTGGVGVVPVPVAGSPRAADVMRSDDEFVLSPAVLTLVRDAAERDVWRAGRASVRNPTMPPVEKLGRLVTDVGNVGRELAYLGVGPHALRLALVRVAATALTWHEALAGLDPEPRSNDDVRGTG